MSGTIQQLLSVGPGAVSSSASWPGHAPRGGSSLAQTAYSMQVMAADEHGTLHCTLLAWQCVDWSLGVWMMSHRGGCCHPCTIFRMTLEHVIVQVWVEPQSTPLRRASRDPLLAVVKQVSDAGLSPVMNGTCSGCWACPGSILRIEHAHDSPILRPSPCGKDDFSHERGRGAQQAVYTVSPRQ